MQNNTELNELIERTKMLPNKPAYKFKVGDKVLCGNLNNVIIIQKYSDYIYLIEYDRIEQVPCGYTPLSPRTQRYVLWTSIRPVCGIQATQFSTADNIKLTYTNTALHEILNRVYHFGVNFCPDYQRDYVWTHEDKEALIDSIFKHVDIGKFLFNYLYDDTTYGYEIIDGKQRLSTLVEFYENKFPYKDVYYNELSHTDRQYFRNYNICYADLRDADRQQVLECFVRVNTTGRTMSKKHLQNVINMLDVYKGNH